MLYYGILYILFGESYPFNDGLTVDGTVYASFIPDFAASFYFDTVSVHRILPSVIVNVFLKIFSVNTSLPNIFTGFQILNLISIVLSCYFLKRILILFKISFKNQMLAFALFLLNFGVIKVPFYLPVMTDSLALMLSTALLFFYLKSNITGLVITTLLCAFTWPTAYFQGLVLIAFPICILPFTPLEKWQKILLHGISIFYILAICIYFVFIEKMEIPQGYLCAAIDRNLLPFSILGLMFLYFFFAKIFFNKNLFNKSLFLEKLNYKRLPIFVGVIASVFLIIHFLHPPTNTSFPVAKLLHGPALYALIKPLISLVADTSYWGIIVCLLLLFWNSFCKTISRMGWGIVAAFGLNLLAFGIATETRVLINLLPWLIVFLIKTINKYSFSNRFYIVVGLLVFVASKIWLSLNIYDQYMTQELDRNGCLNFPGQIMWMNFGPWMNEQMYYVQGGAMLVFTGILFLMLYKVEMKKITKIRLVKKY